MILLTTVHTTGVNWEGVLTVVASITVVLTAFTGLIMRSMKSAIRSEIHDVIALDVSPILVEIQNELKQHDTRIARLEGVEEGKQYVVRAANVTTVNPG